MNEEDIPPEEEEEEAASDRTLVAENEEENPSPEYRMATITPSVNTVPIADEGHEDDEATLADPTIMTLQTPLPDQQMIRQQQQQNMHRLMEKIERQRKAAENRTQQQTKLQTPTMKTPKKLVVSPGYVDSGSSVDSSEARQDVQEEGQSSANTTTAEIEERRIQLEFVDLFPSVFQLISLSLCRARKQALEQQIRRLTERANVLPQNSTGVMISSSSDLSIESLLKNLRPTSNTASIPSASSSIYAGKQREDDHEQFAQAVQAIVTSDESQSQTSPSSASSSRIHIDDDQRSHGNTSDDINQEKTFFDKYESHSSEDRDQSLENLISRLLAAQQQSSNRHFQSNIFFALIIIEISPDLDDILSEVVSSHAQQANQPLIIDDLVDDVLSSISSLSAHTPVDQRSASPEIAQLLSLHRPVDSSQEFNRHENDQNHFLEEKRLIEEELEMIRRERESLLHEHEKYRQQTM